MNSTEQLPKIVTDIKDVIRNLVEFYENTKEPITDDNNCLHRLCAKLELVLTLGVKEKSLLGQKRTYWHWIYSCLRKKNGLNDSLKFVQANKEVRSSKGRGRAFIRYCLVHQTLADSLQNCLLQGQSYLKPVSVLSDDTYAKELVQNLYDLNAVYFDLNSKGYDLDSGWPTFASKRVIVGSEHWAVQSQMGLSSLPPPSVIMDSRLNHGFTATGSSGGPPSAPSEVDQRMEELILELEQSDKTIKEHTRTIHNLRRVNSQLEKEILDKEDDLSGVIEKEEILAKVISDLESKNRHLHDALSHMSDEFQTRDEGLSRKLETMEQNNKELVEKNSRLQEDKYNLEQLVSRNMENITSNFTSSSDDLANDERHALLRHNNNVVTNDSPSEQLLKFQQYAKCLERLIQTKPELNEHLKNLRLAINNGEVDDEMMTSQRDSDDLVVMKIVEALGLDEEITELTSDNQVNLIIDTIDNLREIERVHQHESINNGCSGQVVSELNQAANNEMEIVNMKQQLDQYETLIHDYKLKLEVQNNNFSQKVSDLEEEVSVAHQQNDSLVLQRGEMIADLNAAHEQLRVAECRIEQLDKRASSLDSANEEEIKALKDQLELDQEINAKLTTELKEAELMMNNLKEELQFSKELVEKYTDKVANCELETSETRNKVIKTEVLLQEKQCVVDESQAKIVDLLEENEEQNKIIVAVHQLLQTFFENFRDQQDFSADNEKNRSIALTKLMVKEELVSELPGRFCLILSEMNKMQKCFQEKVKENLLIKQRLELQGYEICKINAVVAEKIHQLKQSDKICTKFEKDENSFKLEESINVLIICYEEKIQSNENVIKQLAEKTQQLVHDKSQLYEDKYHLENSKIEETNNEKVENNSYTSMDLLNGSFNMVSKLVSNLVPTSTKARNNEEVTIGGGDTLHIPLLVEQIGLYVVWRVELQGEIFFSLLYSQDEEGDLHQNVICPARKMDGSDHIQITAEKIGYHTLVLDNSFDKTRSKKVSYKIDIMKNENYKEDFEHLESS